MVNLNSTSENESDPANQVKAGGLCGRSFSFTDDIASGINQLSWKQPQYL